MSIANLVRRFGTLPTGKPWRKVHAQRARKLRRRGDDVRFVRFNRAGRAVYEWRPAVVAQPYQKRLFEMLADLEREADAMNQGGQDFMELAKARTRPFPKPMVMTATTPNRTETVEQWDERLVMSGIKSVRECRDDWQQSLHQWIDVQLGKPYEPGLQTGRTTRQMQTAPANAWFVWPTSDLGYPEKLARRLGRQDLRMIRLSCFSQEWACSTSGHVVFDHACQEHMRYRRAVRSEDYYQGRAFLRNRGRLVE